MKTGEVYDVIRHHLSSNTPMALARLGDGESMVLHTSITERPRKMDWFLKNQFGYVMDDKRVLEIKDLVLWGYSNCDIIGVPTQRHRDKFGVYWADGEKKMNELAPKTKDIPTCSIDIHSELLDTGLIYQLIEGQQEVICIFGRDLDTPLKRRFGLDEVHSFKFTPEQRYQLEQVESEYYPKEYNQALKFIWNTDCKGKLCLVGCGMLGKNLVAKLKEAGGIAVDIGHVPDTWAGLVTRGKNKGPGVTQNTHKL